VKERASYGEALSFQLASFGLIVALGLVSSVAIARVYGVDVVGEYALVMAATLAVTFLSSAREQAALVRELVTLPHRSPRVTGLFGAVMAFSFALTVIVAAIVMVVVYFLFKGPVGHPDLFVPALVTMVGYVLLNNTSWNLDMVFSAFRAGRQLFWIRVHESVMFLVAAIVGGMFMDDIWGLVLATLLSYATVVVHRIVSIRPFMRLTVGREDLRDGFQTLPSLIRFGLKITPGVVADGISNQTGTWMLGIASSVSAVGAFSRAWMLARRLADLHTKVAEMLFPTLVERHRTGDHEGFDRALLDSMRYIGVGLLLPAAAGGGAAQGVMELFGPGFARASDALAILLVMPALTVMATALGLVLLAVDRPLMHSAIIGGRMVATIALTVPLTLSMGITGTAIAASAGYALELPVRWFMTRPYLTRPGALWPIRERLAVLVAYAAGFAAAWAVDSSLRGAVGLMLGLVAGSLAYAAAYVVAGGLNDRDRDRLGSIWTRARGLRGGRAAAAAATATEPSAPDPPRA
jgi:O-antigen/teichoic acid export membrane protein